MVEIGRHHPKTGVLQKDIAANQGISIKYLDHILLGLKIAGLVASAGKKKGYVLTKEPKDITVYDVWRAVNPELYIVECLSPNLSCERDPKCPVKTFWSDLNRTIVEYLNSATLQTFLDTPALLTD
jgi:Rrf2 family protein